MIDVHSETLITFGDVPAWTEQHLGRRVHPSTIHRWRLRGARGVKLETLLAGGTRYTSAEALSRFFIATTAAADGVTLSSPSSPPSLSSASSTAKSVRDAEAYLADEGI